jgi:hypothetical protein
MGKVWKQDILQRHHPFPHPPLTFILQPDIISPYSNNAIWLTQYPHDPITSQWLDLPVGTKSSTDKPFREAFLSPKSLSDETNAQQILDGLHT